METDPTEASGGIIGMRGMTSVTTVLEAGIGIIAVAATARGTRTVGTEAEEVAEAGTEMTEEGGGMMMMEAMRSPWAEAVPLPPDECGMTMIHLRSL